jgi:hypothetical protein
VIVCGAGFATWAWREAQRRTFAFGQTPLQRAEGRCALLCPSCEFYQLIDAASAAFKAQMRNGNTYFVGDDGRIYVTRAAPSPKREPVVSKTTRKGESSAPDATQY